MKTHFLNENLGPLLSDNVPKYENNEYGRTKFLTKNEVAGDQICGHRVTPRTCCCNTRLGIGARDSSRAYICLY